MSGGSQTAPTPFQPPNQAGAASSFLGGTNTLAGGASTVQNAALPGYQSIYNNVQNNPYAGQAQTGANTVAGLSGPIGQGQIGSGQQLQNLGAGFAGDVNGVIGTGFDPQNALYNRTSQQLMDQQNAINGMNGVSGSPYGAGLTGQTASNFNIDWQNNQQGRQLAALQAAQGLGTTAAGLDTQGAGLEASGLNTIQTGANAPSQQYLSNQNSIAAALNSLVSGDTNAFGLTQEQISDLGQYLNIGQTASQGAIQAAQVNNQAAQSAFSGLGSLFGDALGMFAFGG